MRRNSSSEKFKIKKELPYLLFLIPALVGYTIFAIYPLLNSFTYAFTDWDGLHAASFVGFENFKTAFKDKTMRDAIVNTLIYSLSVPLFITMLAIPLACILNKNIRGRNFYRASFFFTSVPSALIMGYLWSYMLNPTRRGLINSFLNFFGVDPILWTAKPALALASVIFVAVWAGLGYHACIYLANLQTIPKEYYEASDIDGASGFQKFRRITFPMLAPSMTISLLLLITGSLKVYDLPLALTNGGPGTATTMITQVIMARGVAEKQYGKATALSVIFFAIIFVITVVQLKITKRREEKLV